jgi:hypothetical protein
LPFIILPNHFLFKIVLEIVLKSIIYRLILRLEMKKVIPSIEILGSATHTCPAGGITMPYPQTWSVLFATVSAAIRSFRRQIRI